MLRTILMGSCVYVQGTFVRNLADGKIVVRVGNRLYQGLPVLAKVAA
ncbi:MAG: hypothetical protein COB40_00415 [Marinosulfonomonas sp.]|nr:MAG: hypothetical protein COB40_00415 [Marinosulfonomonas sp.]